MDNRAIIRRLFQEVLNQRRLEVLDELIGPGFVEHNPAPGQVPGAEGIKRKLAALWQAFPDLRFTLEDLAAEGDRVAVRYFWEGTQQGEFSGLKATGRAVRVGGMDFYRLAEGKIVEHWDCVDQLGLWRQLSTPPG